MNIDLFGVHNNTAAQTAAALETRQEKAERLRQRVEAALADWAQREPGFPGKTAASVLALKSYAEIARILNTAELDGPSGKRWTRGTIHAFIDRTDRRREIKRRNAQ